MTKREIEIVVHKIEGTCPVFRERDTFLVKDGYILESEIPLCIHALRALLHFASLIARGFTGADLGLGDGKEAYVACPDPGPPLTPGGRVIFRLTAI